MNIEKRKNESASILHRNKMEEVPTGVDVNKWKSFRDAYNRAAMLETNDSPAQLDIEINSDCNMKCSFCIHSIQENRHISLGYEKFTMIIDEAVSMGIYSLKLNYMNEPLLVSDIEKYILYAKNAGMINIFMSTNGINLTESRSISLIKSGITKLFISIDATTSEIYKQLRNSSKYNLVVNNINRFIDIRNSFGLTYPLVRVNFLENSINTHQKNDFISYWNNRADIVIIQEMNELIDNKTKLFIDKKKKDYHCSFPYKQLVITADGNILPCCTMHGIKHKLGKIGEMTLLEAWNCNEMIELRKLHKDGRYKENIICRHCVDGY